MTRLLAFCLVGSLFAAAARAQDMPLSDVLIDGEGWELVSEGHTYTEGPAADREGNVYFTDVRAEEIYRIDAKTGKVSLFDGQSAKANGLMCGPDGRLYACRNGEEKIVAYTPDGKFETIVDGIASNDLAVAPNGGIYVTDPNNRQVWYVSPDRKKRVVADGFRPNGLILWPDGGTLVIADTEQPHLWTYRVEADGSLTFPEPYYRPLQTPPGTEIPLSDGLTVDADGRVYVATAMGLQMFDPTGRLGGAIARPQAVKLSNATFGGPDFNYLYATNTDKVYRRLTKVRGVTFP